MVRTPSRNRLLWTFAGLAWRLFVLFLPAPASATTRFVPDNYATIQAAINASVSGDSVVIRPGTYTGTGNRDVDYLGKDLVVKGEGGASAVVIDCQQLGRGFIFRSYETTAARLEGVTIRNGRAGVYTGHQYMGGAVLCLISSPTIADCVFTGCDGRISGGGVNIVASSTTVERCRFTDNTVEDSGGGLNVDSGNPVIRDCVFSGNRAWRGGGVGFPGTANNRLIGCTITANVANYGGGIYSGNLMHLERTIVWGNCGWVGGEEIECVYGGDAACSLIDVSGVEWGELTYDAFCIDIDPQFCGPAPCGIHSNGDWTLAGSSPCLPQYSLCGQLIGALGQGCGPATGACCFADGSCSIEQESPCESAGGSWQGSGTPCVPNPCQPVPVEKTSWGRIKERYRTSAR